MYTLNNTVNTRPHGHHHSPGVQASWNRWNSSDHSWPRGKFFWKCAVRHALFFEVVPKLSVLANWLAPTSTAFSHHWRLPRDSSISISPDRGQPPYTLCDGISHSAGHNQSPAGILARISTCAYLKLKLPLVLRRAVRTGGAGKSREHWNWQTPDWQTLKIC